MTGRSFPLVAILPDLWTVIESLSANPVSQHATLRLAVSHCDALHESTGRVYSVVPPVHSPVAVAIAREAIRKAQRKARESDPRAHWVVCGCCSLWHDPDEDCPPPRRNTGYYHEDDPT